MKKAIIIIVSVLFCLILGIAISGFFLVKRITSERVLKDRLIEALNGYGETTIEHISVNLAEGVIIDNLSFTGTSENVQGRSLKVRKIILQHNPLSLLKGQITVNKVTIISPELTIEKPAEIWVVLDTIKATLDRIDVPVYSMLLRNGIEIRDMKIHVIEDVQSKSPEINLSGINGTILPFAGSLTDISIRGHINDIHLGNYSFMMTIHPDVPRLDIEAHAHSIMLNEKFLSRFPYIGRMIWDDYKPSGKVNVSCKAFFDNRDNQKEMDYIVTVRLNGITAQYKNWPFLINNLSGDVEINAGKLFLKGIVGYIKNSNRTSQAEIRGEFDLSSPHKTLVMTIPNLFINEELLKSIPKIGEQVWKKIQPRGPVDLVFQYNEDKGMKSTKFLDINCKGLEVLPSDFSLPITYVNGQVKLSNTILLFKNTSGYIHTGNQPVFTEMNGVYDLESGRRIFTVTAPDLFISEASLNKMLGKEIGEKVWTNLKPAGKVDIHGSFQGYNAGNSEYNLDADLKDCEISLSKYQIPLWGIKGRISLTRQGLISKHIDAKCAGGHVEGSVSVTTGTNPFQYDGDLNFSRIAIEELVTKITEPDKTWSGLLYGNVKFKGSGTDTKDIYAKGQINIQEGYLSDVPIILSILNFLNLSLPKKDRFHHAKVNFTIKDGIVYINKGSIYSDTIELNARGNISLDGKLHIDVVAGFSNDFLSKLPVVGRLFELVVGGVRKQLTMVEVTGTFSNIEVNSVPFKPIRESIKNMFDVLPKHNHIEPSSTGGEKKESPL